MSHFIPFHSISSFDITVVFHELLVGVGSNASPVKFPPICVRVSQPFRLVRARVPQPFLPPCVHCQIGGH